LLLVVRFEQVLPGFMAARGGGGRTLVLAQGDVTSEELAVERKVG
jgi:hypothetical protein